MPQYLEQYERMNRWHARFEILNKGQTHDKGSDNYVDDIYAFFMNCYHLKDWIKNDPAVPQSVKNTVEHYVSSNSSLSLCADICNSLKHLTLTKHRSGQNPTFGAKHYKLELGGGPAQISLSYEVNTNAGPVDAFQLATGAKTAWASFLSNNALI